MVQVNVRFCKHVPQKIGVKGKGIGSQGLEIINNVTKFMEQESKTGIKIPITQYKCTSK